jgi:protein ImuB
MLDITGCAHLFGGEAGLGNLAGRSLQRGGLKLKAAIAGTPDAARAAAANRLAAALFRDFPGESGRTIRVR